MILLHMISFKEYVNEKLLLEKYLNTVKRTGKEKYAQQVWDILQYSYRDIGGIKRTVHLTRNVKEIHTFHFVFSSLLI